ncbi:MAG: hypothetical protein AAGL90_09000 [Pseudomonadota bacterium]
MTQQALLENFVGVLERLSFHLEQRDDLDPEILKHLKASLNTAADALKTDRGS